MLAVSSGAQDGPDEETADEQVQAKVLSESRQMHVQAAQFAAKALRLCLDVPELARQVPFHRSGLRSFPLTQRRPCMRRLAWHGLFTGALCAAGEGACGEPGPERGSGVGAER